MRYLLVAIVLLTAACSAPKRLTDAETLWCGDHVNEVLIAATKLDDGTKSDAEFAIAACKAVFEAR